MKRIKKVYLWIENSIYYISYIALFLIMISISADAFARVLFNSPIHGAYEVVTLYFMIIVVFIGLGYSYKNNEHVKIAILYQLFPKKGKLFADFIGIILSILFFSIMAIKGYQMTYEAWTKNYLTFGIVSIPMFLSYIWVPLGTLLLLIRLFGQLLKTIEEFFKPPKVGDQ